MASFDNMNQRLGLTTHASQHQANPDGSDLAVRRGRGPGSIDVPGQDRHLDNEFNQWSRSSIEDIRPRDFSAPPPPMPTRQR
jgi:hypothetical protein